MQDRGSPASTVAKVDREVDRVSALLGQGLRDERVRRRLTIRAVADGAGLGRTTVSDIEAGNPASLETYVRMADALRLKADFQFMDPRRRDRGGGRAVDPVHAAMGDVEAAHFRSLGYEVGLDEPFQHYQFAGRADVVAWSAERSALLHIENRTRFPDLQDAFGTFNAKRRYLGPEIGAAAGVARWRSETHVMAALWSAEVMRTLRSHSASFESVCPDSPDAFESWWRGDPPTAGRHSILLIFDPIEGRRRDRRRWAALTDLPNVRPLYRDYADAAAAL
jgi:hypothetical protein